MIVADCWSGDNRDTMEGKPSHGLIHLQISWQGGRCRMESRGSHVDEKAHHLLARFPHGRLPDLLLAQALGHGRKDGGGVDAADVPGFERAEAADLGRLLEGGRLLGVGLLTAGFLEPALSWLSLQGF